MTRTLVFGLKQSSRRSFRTHLLSYYSSFLPLTMHGWPRSASPLSISHRNFLAFCRGLLNLLSLALILRFRRA